MRNRLAKLKARAHSRGKLPQLAVFKGAKEVMASNDPALFERQLDLAMASALVTSAELELPAVQAMFDSDTIDFCGRAPDGRFVLALTFRLRLDFAKYVLRLTGPKPFLQPFIQRVERN